MFGALSEKLQGVFSKFRGKRSLTEENISDGVRDVRLALLEADVNYGVTKTFIKRVKEKALGQEVLGSVDPGQQFIKVIHDELVTLMGGGEGQLAVDGAPAVILMCGLQGSGKTTTSAKLARYLKEKRCLLAACDLQRAAAVEQLKQLAKQAEVSFFSIDGESNPLVVADEALRFAKRERFDLLIVDTAGRLHVDELLMAELTEMKRRLKPREVLFVANATTGQDAVKSAQALDERVGITGTVLTMLDGDGRAGAAISIREVAGKPLLFEGVGEKLDDFQLFNPTSMADRILGMGDTINLVKRAEEQFDTEEGEKLQKKLRKASFTYDDYLQMMGKVEKMGSLKGILKMLPVKIDGAMLDRSMGEFKKVKAIIYSMTPKERREEDELDIRRRKRLSKGSGTDIGDVNRLVKSFRQAKKMMKQQGKMKQMKQMMGGTAWR